jgi:hypothetical protein
MLREAGIEAEGVGDVGGFLVAAAAGEAPDVPDLNEGAHSPWSTCPPERQIANSASRAAIYF